MQKFRVNYQNHMDKVIRNRHANVKADNAQAAYDTVMAYGDYIAIYKVTSTENDIVTIHRL
jgi:hypothetical protein